jgi:hypothetical protein
MVISESFRECLKDSGLIDPSMTKNIEYLVDLLLINILDQIWI